MQATEKRTLSHCAVAFAFALAMASPAYAQAPARLSGALTAQLPDDHGTIEVSFSCELAAACTGFFRAISRDPRCTNRIATVDAIVIGGLDLSRPGPIAGGITMRNFEFDDRRNPDGSCSTRPGEDEDAVLTFTGTWDGSASTLVIAPVANRDGELLRYSGTISTDAVPPVFELTAAGRADATATNLTSTIQYRPEDRGRDGSVYVFALAPVDLALPADPSDKPLKVGKTHGKGPKDVAVACVLAQLTSTGQLQAVSASALQAFVTGVLSEQGQAVTMINGVATANIGGATFYVGYGNNAAAMLTGGLNRSVVTVPGTRECLPQRPQTGWWWNPAEGGRGYSIEVQGNHIFYAAFLYDESGRSNWFVATGTTSLDGSLFTSELLRVTNGQTLGGAYQPPAAVQSVGPFTLAFSDASNGTMVWPGGTVAIERFNIVPNGLNAAPRANQPESGWWWNPQESGRGFFIEWQDGTADLAGYMYDEAGNATWYLSVFPTPDLRQFTGNWWLYANGQSLTGAYRPATRINENVAPVTVQFTSATTATMTLPNGRTTALQRHRF